MFTRYQYKVIRYVWVLLCFLSKQYISERDNKSKRRATPLFPGIDMRTQILQRNNTNKRNCVQRVSWILLQDPDRPARWPHRKVRCVHIHVDTRNVYQVHQIINPLTHVTHCKCSQVYFKVSAEWSPTQSFHAEFFLWPSSPNWGLGPSLLQFLKVTHN